MSDYFVHESAIVEPGASIGKDSKVWHFSHVMRNSQIGDDCTLGQNVFVACGVVIGNRCRIQNNVSLYDGVELCDDVFCGPGVVFTNVRNPRASVSRKHLYEPTRVELGATLGANCTIVCGVTIGRYGFVAAGAVVTKDVIPFALVSGVPAIQVGWVCICGERLLPDQQNDFQCRCCKRRYHEMGEELSIFPSTETYNDK